LEPAWDAVADLERSDEPHHRLPDRAVCLDRRPRPADRRDRLRSATTAVALVLLSVVFLLGLATYGRLVQINSEDVAITRAMNRLRHAYLVMAPDLRPYFSTGHHDDERGIATTHLLGMGSHLQTWPHFLVTTPTIVATVDAAVATAMVVLAGLTVEAPTGAVVAAGVVAFLVIWGALFLLQRLNLGVLRDTSARFPTPPDEP
jgi:hypothetical protein